MKFNFFLKYKSKTEGLIKESSKKLEKSDERLDRLIEDLLEDRRNKIG